MGTSGVGSALLQHSLPAQKIVRKFFPTYLPPPKLRLLYRPPLDKHKSSMKFVRNAFRAVDSLAENILRVDQVLTETICHGLLLCCLVLRVSVYLSLSLSVCQERERQRLEHGGAAVFAWRHPTSLSATDGQLVLCEFSEQYPPIMQQPGMAYRVRNYFKRVRHLVF